MRRRTKVLGIIIMLLIIWSITLYGKTIDNVYNSLIPQETKQETKQETMLEQMKREAQEQELALKKQQEQEEMEKLQKLQNPEYVLNALNEMTEVGKLISYESTITFKEPIVDNGILRKRTLYVNRLYRFGIGIDLSKITVGKIEGRDITVNIPVNEIKLLYFGEDVNMSHNYEKKNFFAKVFNNNETEYINNKAYNLTMERLNNTPDIFFEAKENAKHRIGRFIINLGYRRVSFNEI